MLADTMGKRGKRSLGAGHEVGLLYSCAVDDTSFACILERKFTLRALTLSGEYRVMSS